MRRLGRYCGHECRQPVIIEESLPNSVLPIYRLMGCVSSTILNLLHYSAQTPLLIAHDGSDEAGLELEQGWHAAEVVAAIGLELEDINAGIGGGDFRDGNGGIRSEVRRIRRFNEAARLRGDWQNGAFLHPRHRARPFLVAVGSGCAGHRAPGRFLVAGNAPRRDHHVAPD